MLRIVIAILFLGVVQQAEGQGRRLLDESEYADRLRAMWLGKAIANWTGLRTEGHRTTPPFFTDADWGTIFLGAPLDFVLTQNPWQADDDTDIEYVYLHLHHAHGVSRLTPTQIASGWANHINRFIWVSNATARQLISRGVHPPSTGLGSANINRLMIDAQLTTEFYGALCPGMPERALAMADLPIRTTSSGYAAHASQFFVILYSLAPMVDPMLSGRDKSIWLFEQARAFIPDSSKTADIADFVYADFLANPDPDDWERTRDAIHARYQQNAAANGFRYRAWYESSVNFACGVMELLYGECDFRRTVRIGTLSGWDSDNATATLGGMIGLMNGYESLTAQFPGVTFSDRFDIYRTRDALPDYLPGDAAAQDTFTLMAQRMIPIARGEVLSAGGMVDQTRARWLLPPTSGEMPLTLNPLVLLDGRSLNNRIRRLGGTVQAITSAPTSNPVGRGVSAPGAFCNGVETEFRGREEDDNQRWFYSAQSPGVSPGTEVTLTVIYDRPVQVHTIRFIEGDHYNDGTSRGGWFESAVVEARINNTWTPVTVTASEPLDSARPFQIIDYELGAPVEADGIRVRGPAGGGINNANAFVTCAELDAYDSPAPPPSGTFDINGDGVLTIEDLHAWETNRTDLDGDGTIGERDRAYLSRAIRWNEREDLVQ